MISVKETTNLKEFIAVQSLIYKNDSLFVKPLIKEEMKIIDARHNPFYKNATIKLFIAYENSKPVGRIAAIINKGHNRFHNDSVGFFGFFESQNSVAISNELFKAAEVYLSKNSMKIMRGPVNPSMNDTCGVLVKGFFQPPVFMMPYNRKYYIDLFESYGFKKAKDLYAFYATTANKPKNKLEKLSNYIQKKYKIDLRNFSRKNFDRDIEIIHHLYSKSWEGNWGFSPPTLEEFKYGTKDFKTLVPEELVIIAERDKKPCGFSALIPDFNQVIKKANGSITPFNFIQILSGMKKIDSYRLITLGVLPECRKMGVDLLFYVKSFEVVEKRKGIGGELSWTLEDNDAINKPIKKMNSEHYKTYRIYEKQI